MRRAWLLALALAPAIAAAQAVPSTGQVTFDDAFVNATECASGGGDISLSWSVTFVSTVAGVPTDGEYHVYASNQQHTSPSCTKDPNTSGLAAGEVGAAQDATGQVMGPIAYTASEFAARAGKSCTAAARETIYVCVQGTAAGGAEPFFGFATGTLTVDVRPPPPPVVQDPPLPGDGALLVTWSPGVATSGASGDSQEYVLEATAVGTTASADPVGIHTSARTIDTDSFRFGGLVNSVVYEIKAFAFSEADNMSEPSNVVTGSPQPVNDFWDAYLAAGGREQGGCGVGAAGAASLLVAAGILAALRRRK